MFGGLVLTVVFGAWGPDVYGGTGAGGAVERSVFDRIWALEQRAQSHRRAAERVAGVSGMEEADRRAFRRLEAARQAADRVRAEIDAVTGHWRGTWRRLRQIQPTLRPGAGRRTGVVLARAQRRVFEDLAPKIRTWQKIRAQVARPAVLLRRQAARSVQLAQHRGAEEALEEKKKRVADEASSSEAKKQAARRDKKEAGEKLDASMGELVDHETGRDFHRRKGALVPPVGAEPTASFGQKKQENSMTYVRHTGLTYAIDAGTDVRATADGLVVHAKRFEGFGRLLIIDHGDDYHSLYAHLQTFEVEVGDKVERGQSIATSGVSGSLSGPKLYFELRHGGKPIDPKPWFVSTK